MAGRLQSEQVADISPECPADIIGICNLGGCWSPGSSPGMIALER
jgi:hypothetical protein